MNLIQASAPVVHGFSAIRPVRFLRNNMVSPLWVGAGPLPAEQQQQGKDENSQAPEGQPETRAGEACGCPGSTEDREQSTPSTTEDQQEDRP